jgi:hypothetical protein
MLARGIQCRFGIFLASFKTNGVCLIKKNGPPRFGFGGGSDDFCRTEAVFSQFGQGANRR